MDRIAIDTIGPLPEDDLGNKYIVTVIDSFSRMVELIPVKDTNAITATNAVMQWICRYGIPSQLVCDNGTQYANELISKSDKDLEYTLLNIEDEMIRESTIDSFFYYSNSDTFVN
jgi:hypothetical protein